MSFLSDAEKVIKTLDKYREESRASKKPVINLKPLEENIRELGLESYMKAGGLSKKRLQNFLKRYLATTTRLHHPAYLAHQVATPHCTGALGALIDGFVNNPMAIYEMGPGASSIEYFLINWMLQKVGWNPTPLGMLGKRTPEKLGGGVLTHGGSLANLTAVLAARNKVAPDAWQKGNPKDLALLAPAGTHYSIARAAGIIGIGQNAMYHLAVDDRGAVIPDKLPEAYERVRNDGKRAIALVANACSTAVGIYDPLEEIGDFCQETKLWLHLDGAHGASALFSKRHRHLLKGVEKADSLVWDAHKLLRTPALCAVLLVRDHRDIDSAFKQEASYLFHDKKQPGFDFVHRTVECTKAGLGLKLFMVLAALGERGVEKHLDRQSDLALKAYQHIEQSAGFACAVEPQSNILCFRVEGDDNLQIKIRDRLVEEGSFYLSTTLFNGIRYLRMVLMNPDTTMTTLKKLIRRIQELKKELDCGMELTQVPHRRD
jgi:L-2,4-diaminobutyrate decarboxylase